MQKNNSNDLNILEYDVIFLCRINGPFAALTSYLSEFHSAKHRARVQMILGIIFSFGNFILPLMAWGILPLNFYHKINDYFGNFYISIKKTMLSFPEQKT